MIKLVHDYYVSVDNNNYTLQKDMKTLDKNGNEVFKPVAYFGSLRNAIIGLKGRLDSEALSSDENITLHEAIKMMNENNKQIEDLLNNLID